MHPATTLTHVHGRMAQGLEGVAKGKEAPTHARTCTYRISVLMLHSSHTSLCVACV